MQSALSVRLSVTQVDQSKTVEVSIMQLSPQSIPIPLVLWYKFNPEILTGSPERGVKQGWGGENKLFSSFMRRYLENGTKYDQGYY